MLQLTSGFLFCALLATIISPNAADYVIDVRLIKFENYNRLLASGRTCSNFVSRHCQTALHVCARPGDSSKLCSYGETKTGVLGDNIIDLNKTFIGLVRNPITYQITQPFQKFVVSFTAKSNNQLISEYVYHSNNRLPQRSVEEARYELITTRGSQNPSSLLTYQIRSYCSQDYYGPNCAVRCFIPTAEQTRFMCNSTGQTVCKSGWSGTYCDIPTDLCRSSPCRNGGTCLPMGATFICNCKPGYTGQYCNKAVSACLSAPCMNGGQCSNVGTSFACQCPPNFYGHICEHDICHSVTCLNGGQCVAPNSVAKCICQPGFTGTQCQTLINSCQSAPCQNGGNCMLVNNQITCTCLNDFYGDRCQFSHRCNPACQNGGTCNLNKGICHCPPGFTGRDCSSTVVQDPCATKPCLNNGQCFVQNNYDYFCMCPQGWTGKICQYPITTPCATNPCLHGGHCYPLGNSFTCTCQPGWMGQRCEISQINPCNPNPCHNNGQCSRLGPNGFSCNCVNGWYGKVCDQRNSPLMCPFRPCLNGGTCIQDANQYRCRCPVGFKGNYCEEGNHQTNFKCPEPSGLFPDPQSCRHFYQCDWSIAYKKDCPGNLHFNKVLQVCDWPYRANCNIGK